MKTIIISRRTLDRIGGDESIFGRGTMKIHAARSCEEILDMHGAGKADLIIAERDLPVMGGNELCSRIRGNKELAQVSIILVCDGAGEADALSRETPANAVIAGPLDSAVLFSKVSELLVVPQRKDMRVPAPVAVQASERKGAFSGLCKNISISGMLLETTHLLSEGDTISVRFMLRHNEIAASCRVMRVAPSGMKFLCGLRFLNPDTKSLIIIDQFVKSGGM